MMFIAHTLITLRDKLVETDKERGAGVVEYALVIGGISIVLVLGAVALNTGLTQVWNDIATYVGSLVPATGGGGATA